MMRKLAYSLLMILCGAVLTISAIFVMMAFSRVFPASDEFQQSCRKFDAEEIKNKIHSVVVQDGGKGRSSGKDGVI